MDYRDLPVITDEQMNHRLAQAKVYTLVPLKTTPETFKAESRPTIREHGRGRRGGRAARHRQGACRTA